MKAHIGVDAGTGIVHTIVATAANRGSGQSPDIIEDITQTSKLIRADDHVVYGDLRLYRNKGTKGDCK